MKPPPHRTILRRAIRWLPAMVWACVIFAGSSVPGSRIPGRFGPLGHLLEYAVLGGLLVIAQWRGSSSDTARIAWTALAICALYAITDEFHQSFVPMRTPDPLDWATDVVGASLGIGVALAASARAAKRRPSGLIDDAAPDEPTASREERER